MSKLTIYYSKNDEAWLAELHKYAADNHWSISLAIRELLSKYFETGPTLPTQNVAIGNETVKVKNQDTISATDKIDPDTFFAQVESKLAKHNQAGSDVAKQVEKCIAERTNSKGELNCYFFNQAREYHPFCKRYCWTRADVWGSRVRK